MIKHIEREKTKNSWQEKKGEESYSWPLARERTNGGIQIHEEEREGGGYILIFMM